MLSRTRHPRNSHIMRLFFPPSTNITLLAVIDCHENTSSLQNTLFNPRLQPLLKSMRISRDVLSTMIKLKHSRSTVAILLQVLRIFPSPVTSAFDCSSLLRPNPPNQHQSPRQKPYPPYHCIYLHPTPA